MKKFFMPLMAIVIAAFMFTGCGGNGGGGTDSASEVDGNGYKYVEQAVGQSVLQRAVDGSPQMKCTFWYFDNEQVDTTSFLMQKLVNDIPEDTQPISASSQGSKGSVTYTFSIYEEETKYPLACAAVYLTANGVTQVRTVNKRFPASPTPTP